MLAIRMQRTGRKGHAQFRVIVQDSRRTPTSGKIVAALGHYDPHTKTANLEKEKAAFYLEHGAQPSDRVAQLLKREGVKLPAWVKLETDKQRSIRNPEKLRRNRPDEPAPVEAVTPDEPAVEEETTEPVATDNENAPVDEAPAEEVAQESEESSPVEPETEEKSEA